MLRKVEDERGEVWYVDDADPAGAAVKTLVSRFYGYIVLPWRFIATGDMPPLDLRDVLRRARQSWYNESEGRESTRLYRLAECVRLLLLLNEPPSPPTSALPSLPIPHSRSEAKRLRAQGVIP